MQENTPVEGNKILSQWLSLNRVLFLYKVVGLSLLGLCLLLSIFLFILATRDPVVITLTEESRFYHGGRSPISLTEQDIAHFVKKYINLRYEWASLELEVIARNISPLITKGFYKKSYTEILQVRKNLGDQSSSASQTVSGVQTNITKDSAVATFDRILRVSGVPLVVPTQVSFRLVKEVSTKWNPMGLYVHSISVHEGK